MKINTAKAAWIVGALLALSLTVHADETSHSLADTLANTTLSGYIDTSAAWNFSDGLPGSAIVPEPSTTVLFLLGLGVTGFAALRRSRSQAR